MSSPRAHHFKSPRRAVLPHTVDSEDKIAMGVFINSFLSEDALLLKMGHVPLDPASDDIFAKMEDGLLLIKLINLVKPDFVDSKSYNKNQKLNVYQKMENLNTAVAAAGRLGCHTVNIGARDIFEGRQTSIMSLVWQLFRMKQMSGISVAECEALACLLEEGENVQAFDSKPEEILARWVRFHLERAGKDVATGIDLTVRRWLCLESAISSSLSFLSVLLYPTRFKF
jgi:hypothetical protein